MHKLNSIQYESKHINYKRNNKLDQNVKILNIIRSCQFICGFNCSINQNISNDVVEYNNLFSNESVFDNLIKNINVDYSYHANKLVK